MVGVPNSYVHFKENFISKLLLACGLALAAMAIILYYSSSNYSEISGQLFALSGILIFCWFIYEVVITPDAK